MRITVIVLWRNRYYVGIDNKLEKGNRPIGGNARKVEPFASHESNLLFSTPV